VKTRRENTRSRLASPRAPLLVAIALAGLVVSTGSAGAHARYERSEPADGAVLAQSPERVDMWTSQEMARSGGLPVLTVVNDSGDVLNEEGAVLDDDDRTHVFAELPPALPDGRYTVIWHTLSDEDGEEARGAFHYYVGEGPAGGGTATPAEETAEPIAETPTAEPTAVASPTPAPSGADGGDDDDVPVWALVLGIAGGAIVGGGGGYLVARGRTGAA
jgi:methionine-rich copper-binding protein CopC